MRASIGSVEPKVGSIALAGDALLKGISFGNGGNRVVLLLSSFQQLKKNALSFCAYGRVIYIENERLVNQPPSFFDTLLQILLLFHDRLT